MKFLGALALSGVFLLPSTALAACVANGSTIVFINGVFSTQQQAQRDSDDLKDEYYKRTSDLSLNFINGYNPSHLGGAGDLIQSAGQIMGTSISSFDRDTILLQIYPQVTTRKLLLVGHSQGSFYSNAIYEYLLAHSEPREAVGVYQVGSPASYVAGGGKYLNSSGDVLLGTLRGIGFKFLPDNIDLVPSYSDGKAQFPGHSFSDAYLAEAPERIVGDIQSTLKNLKPTWASDKGDCFDAPDAGISYQAAKVGFAVADTAANGIKAGAGAAQVAAVAAGNAIASVAQGAHGFVNKFVADIGITVGGVAGLSHAAEPSKTKTNFGILSKFYGSSVSKDDYKELMGSAVATAPVFNKPLAVVQPVQQTAPAASQEDASVVVPLLSGSGGARHHSVSADAQPAPAPEPLPGDTTPPIFAGADDISNEAGEAGININYDLPAAQDDIDGSVAVSCDPSPGSLFALGTTTVSCSAHDAAGNAATTTFAVSVSLRQPHSFTIASQEDESHLCDDPMWGGWHNCFVGPQTSFYTTKLGSGLDGALDSLTIAKDLKYGQINLFHPYLITIECFIDGSYTTPCTDWVMPGPATGNRLDAVMQGASESSDGKYWTAHFINREGLNQGIPYPKDASGSGPAMFNPAYYYRLTMDDRGWETGMYGSATDPYWVLKGIK